MRNAVTCLFFFFCFFVSSCWTTFLPVSLLFMSLSGAGCRTSFLLKWICNSFWFLRIYKLKQIIFRKQANDANKLHHLSSLCLLSPLELLVYVLGIYFYLGKLNLCNFIGRLFGSIPRLEMNGYFFYFWIRFLSLRILFMYHFPPPQFYFWVCAVLQ